MTVHTDPLADAYLCRLEAAAAGLPAHQREELVSDVRDHLTEALRQVPAGDRAAVQNVLERLGPPEDIVAAAAPAQPGLPLAHAAETSGSAIVSVLLGALWFGGIGSVLALVFGYRARRAIRNSGGRQKGSGLATAGIILGWIGIAFLAAGAVAGIIAAIVLAAGPSASPHP